MSQAAFAYLIQLFKTIVIYVQQKATSKPGKLQTEYKETTAQIMIYSKFKISFIEIIITTLGHFQEHRRV